MQDMLVVGATRTAVVEEEEVDTKIAINFTKR